MNAPARARAYLAKLPPALAGSGGHAATFAAACRLVEFGLPWESAWRLLLEWNKTHCQPAWCERDLWHKLADAFRHTSPKPQFVNADRETVVPLRPLTLPRPSVKLDTRRPLLPHLDAGKERDFAQLASVRGLSASGVRLASVRGLLRFGVFRGSPAWFVTDISGRNAQARRMSGHPWEIGVKAWTLCGSQAAWPVGIGEADGFPVVALCEGGPDLLAAHGFIGSEGREADCAAVAVLGASCPIHADALPQFAGKRVRIFGHADDAGQSAVNRWAEQLAAVGADVDAFNFAGLRTLAGADAKDLNDLARVHPDDFDRFPCLQNLLP